MRVITATICLLLIAMPASAGPFSEFQGDTPIAALKEPVRNHTESLRDEPVDHVLYLSSNEGQTNETGKAAYYGCWTAYWATIENTRGLDVAEGACADFFAPDDQQQGNGFSAARLANDVVNWVVDLVFG